MLYLLDLSAYIDHDETFQAYSSFTTNYKPADQYESLLVKASKSKAQAVKAFQRRERFENSLVRVQPQKVSGSGLTLKQIQASYSLEGYAYYIASEKRPKQPDLFILKGLYERAITEADKRRFAGEANAEEALRSFWTGYVDLLVRHTIPALYSAPSTIPARREHKPSKRKNFFMCSGGVCEVYLSPASSFRGTSVSWYSLSSDPAL